MNTEVCRFVPGKTYKSRDGKNTYTFIGYCETLPEVGRAIFALHPNTTTQEGLVVKRWVDGRFDREKERPGDIMFEETVWVNMYRDASGNVFSGKYTYQDECAAKANKLRNSTYIGAFPVTING
jgi:hypothetical protein